MDQFIIALRALCQQLIPILAAVVLVVLIVFLIELVKAMKTLNVSLQKTHLTFDLANQSIDKIQAPLDTVVRVSGSVDKAYDAGAKALSQAKEYVAKNADVLKEKVSSLRSKEVEVKEIEVKEPSPEDIIEEAKYERQQ